MDKIQYWGYLSSIATCISLLLYIIGNFISGLLSLRYSKRYNGELFVWQPNEEMLKNFYIVHKEEGYIPDYDSGIDKLMISSEGVLLNVKAFQVIWEEGNDFRKEKEIFSYKRLSQKECIVLSTLLPEGIPNIKLEWETPTYTKASLILAYNGRTGNIYENIEYKHNIRSVIFYLFS